MNMTIKQTYTFLVVIGLLSGCTVAHAELSPSLFRIESLGEMPTRSRACHVFSDKKTAFPVAVYSDTAATLDIRADLIQTSSGLAVFLKKDLAVADGIALKPDTFSLIKPEFEIPEVNAPTHAVLRLKWCEAGGKDGRPFKEVINIVAYPPKKKLNSKMKKLIDWIEDDQNLGLAVFGEKNPFRNLLQSFEVEFEDLGESIPEQWEDDMFYLGSGDADEIDAIFTGRSGRLPDNPHLIIFAEDVKTMLPGLYPTPMRGSGIVIKLFFPELYQYRSPQAQHLFYELLSGWAGTSLQ